MKKGEVRMGQVISDYVGRSLRGGEAKNARGLTNSNYHPAENVKKKDGRR